LFSFSFGAHPAIAGISGNSLQPVIVLTPRIIASLGRANLSARLAKLLS